jgi:hypothetical protein
VGNRLPTVSEGVSIGKDSKDDWEVGQLGRAWVIPRCYTLRQVVRAMACPFIRFIGRLVLGKVQGVADAKSFRGAGCGWRFRLNE